MAELERVKDGDMISPKWSVYCINRILIVLCMVVLLVFHQFLVFSIRKLTKLTHKLETWFFSC